MRSHSARRVSKNNWWIFAGTLAGGGIFAFWLYNSIMSDVNAPPDPAFAAVEERASEGQAFADAQHAQFESLLGAVVAQVRGGNIAEAYGAMATGYRGTVPLERFEAVRSNTWLTSGQSVSVRRSQITSGTARVEGVLVSGSGNVDLVAHFTDEAGTWKLTGLQLGGTPALPGP